ncbi:DUF2306 domain-containing protein [Ammoniphilus sp. CFH 90114]|nr:DUF2306 domain-containing protein [Ammoniphilus sp. CFH 90114]
MDFFRWLHIAAGFLALSIFWVPILTKKGGKVHNRVGWVYVASMATVSVSALYMGVYRILSPQSDLDTIAFSWFLVFISILSGGTAWYGVRVLRFKKHQGKHREWVDLLLSSLLLISGVGISIYGFRLGFPLLQWFPLIGVFLGATQLYYWIITPMKKMRWIIEHIIGMLSCCIATVTAFTVFGAPRLLDIESVSPLLWFLPSMIMTPLIIGFSKHYEKKYNKKKAVVSG